LSGNKAGHSRANGTGTIKSRTCLGKNGARYPKKSHDVLCVGNNEKYAWIVRHQKQGPITLQCEVLNDSTSGYFDHQRRKDSHPSLRISNKALLVPIKAAHADSKGEYGWPRIWKELIANGVRIGKERIQRLMKLHGIKVRGKRKFVVTTDSKHNLPIAPNLLNRNFQPAQPNAAWTNNITYIQTDKGWLYLAAVIDLYRLVVGWLHAARYAN
jgi:putative transposase